MNTYHYENRLLNESMFYKKIKCLREKSKVENAGDTKEANDFIFNKIIHTLFDKKLSGED